jgi:hypothetical protein
LVFFSPIFHHKNETFKWPSDPLYIISRLVIKDVSFKNLAQINHYSVLFVGGGGGGVCLFVLFWGGYV